MWTKEKFIKEFGEDPEDLFGPDWENYVEEYFEEREAFDLGNKFGSA